MDGEIMIMNFESWHFVEVDGELVAGYPTFAQANTHKFVYYPDNQNVGVCILAKYLKEKHKPTKEEIVDYANSHPELSHTSDKIKYVKAIRHLYDLGLKEAIEVYERLWR